MAVSGLTPTDDLIWHKAVELGDVIGRQLSGASALLVTGYWVQVSPTQRPTGRRLNEEYRQRDEPGAEETPVVVAPAIGGAGAGSDQPGTRPRRISSNV
jgi:hypothetical protein